MIEEVGALGFNRLAIEVAELNREGLGGGVALDEEEIRAGVFGHDRDPHHSPGRPGLMK